MTENPVEGYCPMGCGWTLAYVDTEQAVMCQSAGCPKPYAVRDILADQETEHVVDFGLTAFTLRHPLRERLGDALMTCSLHQHLVEQVSPPQVQGKYRSVCRNGQWTFERVGGMTP